MCGEDLIATNNWLLFHTSRYCFSRWGLTLPQCYFLHSVRLSSIFCFKLFTHVSLQPFHSTTQTSKDHPDVFFTWYCSPVFLRSFYKCSSFLVLSLCYLSWLLSVGQPFSAYIMIRIIVIVFVAVDLWLFSCSLWWFFICVFFPLPFRFRYLQENEIEELLNEGFNGLSRLKILWVKLCY